MPLELGLGFDFATKSVAYFRYQLAVQWGPQTGVVTISASLPTSSGNLPEFAYCFGFRDFRLAGFMEGEFSPGCCW